MGVRHFIAGAACALVCAGTVWGAYAAAAGGIKSVAFNNIAVSFNGADIDISSNPMISVATEGKTGASNYMPVREVLSAMGYGVAWRNATSGTGNARVLIFSPDYLESSEDWINFEDVTNIIEELPDALERDNFAQKIYYDEGRKAVHVNFDENNEWDLCTVVTDGAVYIDRKDFESFSSLFIPAEVTQKLRESVPWYFLFPR